MHKRSLPWRDLDDRNDTSRGYKVLVSEIMLQQTQVERVKATWRRFLETFPVVEALAEADNRDVITAWRGMGYNSRALRLRDAARVIVNEFNGTFPREMDALLSIKGIGTYTAAAVRNFAFDMPTPCIDTNIRRILHRTFYGPERRDGTWSKNDKHVLELADRILRRAVDPSRLTGDIRHTTAQWHAALMDFGSLVCTARSPKWDECPLTRHGLCKAAYDVPDIIRAKKNEPGREIGGRFVPDRIIRGRVVDELRDEVTLSAREVGRRVCIDWSEEDHMPWLNHILQKLIKDGMLIEDSRTERFSLRH